MIIAYMLIGLPGLAATSAQNTTAKSRNICMMQAGDVGKLKYRANTQQEAFQKVADACFQKRSSLFVKARNQEPDQDRQIQFVEACVNNIKCI
ncbi:MAG: hypothetical protein KDD33_09290 [Bdellovibrionales bacterium]|nr:hypothetical protein [Bdellovibrionales bacterium]